METQKRSPLPEGLSPHEQKIYEALRNAHGEIVPKSALIDAMYGDREDGGPDSAETVMRICVSSLRRKLGTPIQSCTGYRIA